MKVTAVERHDHYCRVTFSRDGESFQKSVRMGNELDVFLKDMWRMAKEADRDISMKLHGDLMHCENPDHNRLIST